MSLVVDLCKMLEVKVSIDLCAPNAGVAEQFLDSSQIPTRLQQVAGEAVPEHVRMDMHTQPALSGPL